MAAWTCGSRSWRGPVATGTRASRLSHVLRLPHLRLAAGQLSADRCRYRTIRASRVQVVLSPKLPRMGTATLMGPYRLSGGNVATRRVRAGEVHRGPHLDE